MIRPDHENFLGPVEYSTLVEYSTQGSLERKNDVFQLKFTLIKQWGYIMALEALGWYQAGKNIFLESLKDF